MIRLLHSADWHLDAPLTGFTEAQAEFLRSEQRKIPEKIAALCRREKCQLLLLSGDLFDGAYTKETFQTVHRALSSLKIPVFISPGNHDFCRPGSVYLEESWPENVHIFSHAAMESVPLPELDCTVWGAGFESMDCPGLLEDFRVSGDSRWNIGVFHSDPTSTSSPYCPITAQQVRQAGFHYLALGHIHKTGSFRSGDALCAWPGCPMGHGYDETGTKGVIRVLLDDEIRPEFLPLDTPRFFDLDTDVEDDPGAALSALLPPAETKDFYRVTLTGYSAGLDTEALRQEHPQVPNLILRDETLPETDLWSAVGEDTLEGVYFRLLHNALDSPSQTQQKYIRLAARISRRILDGQEVKLP